MANYSVSQSRHLYVAKSYSETIAENSAVGAIGGVTLIDDTLGKQFMFLYKGANTVLRSDLIQLKNLDYAKAIPASEMVTPMKKVKIALDANVNGGAVVSGQDYVLSITFRNFFSSGDASQYFKDAVVHGISGMTATQFYAAMVTSLNAAFSREYGATSTANPYVKFTSDANGIYIEEKPQEWALGTKKARRVMFDVFCSTIYTAGEDLIWGVVTDQTPAKASATVGTNAVGNGQQIADLEWFCMGERGDQYRMKGWPNYIPTTYLVDSTQQYHVLELHFAFTDSGVNSYRTEKEITVVAPATADGKTALNGFIGAINDATGLEIDTLE